MCLKEIFLQIKTRKKQYYSPIFKHYFNDQLIQLKRLFGNDLAEQMLKDSGIRNPDIDVSKDTTTDPNTTNHDTNHDH